MTMIERELHKIQRAMAAESGSRHRELYAAQQALAWVSDPECFKSPFRMITGTQGGSGDCSAHLHPLPSSDTCCRTG